MNFVVESKEVQGLHDGKKCHSHDTRGARELLPMIPLD